MFFELLVTNTINKISNAPIRPPIETGDTIPGVVLAATVFILGSILMLIFLAYILMMVFGQPMSIARNAAQKGSIIQHFNTSKSAVFKIASISGGAFRYANVRDGTVAATPDSVNIVDGRNMVLTFAQLGITIPIPALAGISVLVHRGVKNVQELRKNLTEIVVKTEQFYNPLTGQNEERQAPFESVKKEVLIEGYDFNNFNNLLKETREEKLIPLVVEAIENFVERNISADYTEKKIKIRELLNIGDRPNNEHLKMMTIAIAVVIIFVIGMFIK